VSAAPKSGLIVVDKPAGLTSHDVVARVRRLAGTRRVGHAGTLDPMATGVLVVGVGKATRLLGYLTLSDKAYDATIRLGVATATDDSAGPVVSTRDARETSEDDIRSALSAFRGDIWQVPSTVSAVKVGGRRSYARARAGEEVELAPRLVTVHRLDIVEIRRQGPYVDVDVAVVCSSGTYVRALARDLGAALGVGAHLTALRRTRVGPYDLPQAMTLESLARDFTVMSLAQAAAAVFPRHDVDAATATRVAHGVALPTLAFDGPVAVFGPDADLVALVENRGGRAVPLAVFATPLTREQ
jgi:tRNA pseudouridine55 synthase